MKVLFIHRALKSKWQEKSELISKMEREVVQMRDNFVAKETKLTEEKDKAIAAGKWVESRYIVDRHGNLTAATTGLLTKALLKGLFPRCAVMFPTKGCRWGSNL